VRLLEGAVMDEGAFDAYRQAVVGKLVAQVRRGFGSAISVDLGVLSERRRPDGAIAIRPDGSLFSKIGEATLLIEWSWRVESEAAIEGGSFSEENKWPVLLRRMEGSTVVDLRLHGRLPEIEMILSNGLRLLSFMTANGQPAWSLIVRVSPKGALSVNNGKTVCEELSESEGHGGNEDESSS
jgi:hypothetical protein